MNNSFWSPLQFPWNFLIMGEGYSFYYKYLLMKHKKLNISTTIHLTRKKFTYSGRYLKADHFEKKNGQGVGHSKMLKGVSNDVKLNLQTSKLSKSIL